MKKTLAILLSAILLLSLAPAAFAGEAVGKYDCVACIDQDCCAKGPLCAWGDAKTPGCTDCKCELCNDGISIKDGPYAAYSPFLRPILEFLSGILGADSALFKTILNFIDMLLDILAELTPES